MITFKASNYTCKCGRKGEYLNINDVFGEDAGNVVCGKCRDKHMEENKTKTGD